MSVADFKLNHDRNASLAIFYYSQFLPMLSLFLFRTFLFLIYYFSVVEILKSLKHASLNVTMSLLSSNYLFISHFQANLLLSNEHTRWHNQTMAIDCLPDSDVLL
jgi:hypothetical protein